MPRTVFTCKEFEAVHVPLDALLKEGRVDVYPEASGKGFFDIDYRGGDIVLVARSYVGLIPINDQIAIHVIPRFPISNLFYILQKADASLKYVSGHLRLYGIAPRVEDDIASMFGTRMLENLTHIQRQGLLRRYESIERDDGLQGEIVMTKTISKYYSQGIRYRQVRRVTLHSTDISENRLIKSALYKLASFYSISNDKIHRRLKSDVESILMFFDQVSTLDKLPNCLGYNLPRYVQRLPNLHRQYACILWVAYLIESRQGVAVEKIGPVTFDTFVVNLADIFEDYIRRVITDHVNDLVPGARVENGNLNEIPLFVQGDKFKVKPDIYITFSNQTLAIFDAKYKPDVKASDRYEVLAFCEALQVKTAIILSPSIGGRCDSQLLGETKGGIKLHLVRIDIGAMNMPAAEHYFIENLRKIIGLAVP